MILKSLIKVLDEMTICTIIDDSKRTPKPLFEGRAFEVKEKPEILLMTVKNVRMIGFNSIIIFAENE